jgi:hypothetical protein
MDIIRKEVKIFKIALAAIDCTTIVKDCESDAWYTLGDKNSFFDKGVVIGYDMFTEYTKYDLTNRTLPKIHSIQEAMNLLGFHEKSGLWYLIGRVVLPKDLGNLVVSYVCR